MTVTTTEDTKETTAGSRATAIATPVPVAPTSDHLVESDLLVEDVSIDGMCGVY